MKRKSIRVQAMMYECSGILGKGRQASFNLFATLEAAGCKFFNALPQYELKPPERVMRECGDVLPNAGLFHSTLSASRHAQEGATEGDANFSFIADVKLFTLDCIGSAQSGISSPLS